MKVPSNEYLLNNCLDQNIKNTLLPLDFINSLTFSSKFNIKNNFITPKSRKYFLLSFIATVVSVIGHIIVAVVYPESVKHFLYLRVLNISNMVSYGTGLIGHFVLNIKYSLENIDLILKTQEACRIIKFQDKSITKFTTWNWIIVVFTLVMYFIFCFLYYYLFVYLNMYVIVFMYSLLLFDLNLIYGVRIISFLNYVMKLMLVELETHSELCCKHNDTGMFLKNNRAHWNNIGRAYVNIFQAFNIYKRIYHFPVS